MRNQEEMNEWESDNNWERRAIHLDYKPDPVYHEKVPKPIRELGSCLFPIPRRKKGWNWPHHLDEYRFNAHDEIFNAYLESGSGYGISCANNLVVVDIDKRDYVDEIMSMLPDTVYQVTGSREGVHLFYKVDGLNTRQTLYHKIPHECDNEEHRCKTGKDGVCSRIVDRSHLGEIKCDPHGYVVGPGSVHPSGNTYGPLEGDEITKVDKDVMLQVADKYDKPDKLTTEERIKRRELQRSEEYVENSNIRYEFYELDADDVVPWLEPNKRVPHPGHGSTTGTNFMKNEDRETFTCWRHDYGSGQGCGLNPRQFLAQLETSRECDDIRKNWPVMRDDKVIGDVTLAWYSWKRAVRDGLITYSEVPTKVVKGYAVERGLIEPDEDFVGTMYWDAINAIKCEMEKPYLPENKPE